MIVFFITIGEVLGCILALALIVIYFLTLIGGNGVLDQSLIASLFISTLAILVYNLIVIYVGIFKSKEKLDKVYSIISLILIIGAMIKGIIVPFHIDGFNYTYTLIPSMIQSTWLVNIITIFLMYFISDITGLIKDKSFEGESFEALRTIFWIYVGAIIVSQLIFSPVIFFGGKDVAKKCLNVICYHEKIGEEDYADDFTNPLDMANGALEQYADGLKRTNEVVTNEIVAKGLRTNYSIDYRRYLSKYNYSFKGNPTSYLSGIKYNFLEKTTKEVTTLFYDFETAKFIEFNFTPDTLKAKDEQYAKKRSEEVKNIIMEIYKSGNELGAATLNPKLHESFDCKKSKNGYICTVYDNKYVSYKVDTSTSNVTYEIKNNDYDF